MKKLSSAHTFHGFAFCVLLAGSLISAVGTPLVAQPSGRTTQSPAKQPIVFKAPKGYMPGDLSKHKGKLFLDPSKPAGMFVGYPSEGQDMTAFTDEMQKTVAGMFLHDAKGMVWTSAALPPHKGIEAESGTLMTTANQEMDVQLAFYVRIDTGVAYGYYAMKHKKSESDDGKFLDASGGGVKAFDELAKSIGGPQRT